MKSCWGSREAQTKREIPYGSEGEKKFRGKFRALQDKEHSKIRGHKSLAPLTPPKPFKNPYFATLTEEGINQAS